MEHRTVLFVSPFLPEVAVRFIGAMCARDGVRVGVISQHGAEALPPEIRRRVVGFRQVEDALHADTIHRAALSLADELGPPHRLLSINEQVQVPVATVRERLGLPGMRVGQALGFRDKSRMKQLLRAAGIPCARYALVTGASQAHRFLEETGAPLVAKPPSGAASQETYRVESAEQLAEVLRAAPPEPGRELLLEEFVTGDEFSFDAFLQDGHIVFHSVTRYDPTPLHVMSNPWIQWRVVLPREVDAPEFDPIRVVAAQALGVLGLETGMCHLEWFRRADGSLVVSEVGARPPGAQFTTLIDRVHDWDSAAAWAGLMVDGEWAGPRERRYAAGAAYLRGAGAGRVRAVHGIDVVERELGHLVTDVRLPQPGQEKAKSYEGEGFIVVRHPETRVVADALRRIVETVRVELGE
jgi:hypothetical protein